MDFLLSTLALALWLSAGLPVRPYKAGAAASASPADIISSRFIDVTFRETSRRVPLTLSCLPSQVMAAIRQRH